MSSAKPEPNAKDLRFLAKTNNLAKLEQLIDEARSYHEGTPHALKEFLDSTDRCLEYTPLVWASSNGSMEAVEMLLGAGATLDTCTVSRHSALNVAMSHGQVDMARRLIQLGIPLCASSGHKLSALHEAARWGIVQVLEELTHNMDVNYRAARGETALHHAVEARQEKAVEVLLALGADPTAVDRDGNTVLHTRRCSLQMCRMLVPLGVDVLACNGRGNQIVHLANNLDAIEFLASHGACVPVEGQPLTVMSNLHREALNKGTVLLRERLDTVYAALSEQAVPVDLADIICDLTWHVTRLSPDSNMRGVFEGGDAESDDGAW